jgi:hypothetical protein
VTKDQITPEVLANVQIFSEEFFSTFDGTYEEDALAEIKGYFSEYVVNNINFQMQDQEAGNETLTELSNKFFDNSAMALVNAYPPYTEEKHAAFIETISKGRTEFKDFFISLPGLTNIFRSDFQELPVVKEYMRVGEKCYNDLNGYLVDPTGFIDYMKDPKNVELNLNFFYLASQVAQEMATFV